jgi:hypothetical protein
MMMLLLVAKEFAWKLETELSYPRVRKRKRKRKKYTPQLCVTTIIAYTSSFVARTTVDGDRQIVYR